MKFLTTPLQATLATICVCSCKHNSNWLASLIHTWTNETHSVVNLQDLIPTLAAIIISNTNLLFLLSTCMISIQFINSIMAI